MFFSRKKFPSSETLEQEEKQKINLYHEFVNTQNSELLNEYNALYKVVNSPDFQQEKKRISQLKYKKTSEYAVEKEYIKLLKNKLVKKYIAGDSDEAIKNNTAVRRYEELKSKVESDEFKAFKQLCEDKNRWQKTEQYQQETRLAELSANSGIAHYLKYAETNYFEEQKNWKLSDEEAFKSSKLNTERWIKSLYWAKELGDNLYSSEDELQAFHGEKNIKVGNNTLTVSTRKEPGQGKFWNPDNGFVQRSTDFTSAVLSSVKSYSSEGGMVKLKMKLSGNKHINHSAWLSTPDNSQSVLLYKALNKHCTVGVLNKTKSGLDKSIETVKIVPFFRDYHIFTVEWNKNEIVWKVNDLEIFRSKNILKNSPLQLVINSTVTEKDKSGDGDMTIDWIRTYQKNQSEE